MVDVHGNVVGMVDQTVQDFSLTNINLAVPINDVVAAADRIISGDTKKAWFGVEQRVVTIPIIEQGFAPKNLDTNGDGRLDPLDFGTLVTYIDPLSPADIAGLKAGDVILRLDSTKIKYAYDWDSTVRNFRIGQLVNVDFARKSASGVWERMSAQVQILMKPDADDKDKKEEGGGGGGYHHSMGLNKKLSGSNRHNVFSKRGGKV
jgi:S1-C subfamily serine protease